VLLHLLEIDHLLDGGGVAAAELGRPAGDEVARVEQLALPLTGELRHVGAGDAGDRKQLPRRRVRLQPRRQLRPERFLTLSVLQSHDPEPSLRI
jgi:hypothetical protein